MDTKHPTGDPNFHIRRSYELEAAGLTENSIKELQIALALDPENGEARLNYAVALGRKSLLLEAIEEAIQVPENDPRRYDALALIGTLRRYLGDLDRAEQDLQRAIELCGSKPQAFLYLAELRLSQNRLEEASENALIASRLNQELDSLEIETELIETFGKIHQAQGKFSEALQDFDRLLELKPNDVTVRLQRASLFETMGLTEQELSELQCAISVNPDDSQILDRVQKHYNSRFEREIQKLRGNYPFSEIESALRKTYFTFVTNEDVTKDEIQTELQDHVFNRYAKTAIHYIPWISKVFALKNCEVIEIGCGTGSSTAAFAQSSKSVYAYEIDSMSASAARARLEIMQIDNARIVETSPDTVLELLQTNHGSGVSVVLLFAVLEHMTISERLKTLKEVWKLLKPGGILIIAETPNRLTYYDHHTSWLPFFHFLPLELAVQYFERSPRNEFKSYVNWRLEYEPSLREKVADGLKRIRNAFFQKEIIDLPQMELIRWGTSVSYHEFEITLGRNLKDLLVADGDAEEMRSLYPSSLEERLLRQYFTEAKIDQPLAFTNAVLNLIFRKPE